MSLEFIKLSEMTDNVYEHLGTSQTPNHILQIVANKKSMINGYNHDIKYLKCNL